MTPSAPEGLLVVDKPAGLTSHDVVRHRLVGRIVAAYDEFDSRGGLQNAKEQTR